MLKWTKDNRYLLSTGAGYTIYKWNAWTGDCEVNNVQESFTEFKLKESQDIEVS